MKHVIITSYKEIQKLHFIPTIIIGFYQGGYENVFLETATRLKTAFVDVDIIGSSSESNLMHTLPHVDYESDFPCLFMCTDVKRQSYTLAYYDNNTFPDVKLLKKKTYATFLLHTLNQHSHNYIETLLKQYHSTPSANLIFGAVAGAPDVNAKTSLYFNGKFLEEGHTILWSIDQQYYHVDTISIHDFDPIGAKMEITKTQNNTLIEIDYKPALKAIETICGTLTEESIEAYDHPFFIYNSKNSVSYYQPLSSIKSIDREAQTITMFKQPNAEDTLQLAIPFSREKQEVQLQKFKRYHKDNAFALLFVCIAYKGHWKDMESIYLMQLSKSLEVPYIGLHSFGEIGPFNFSEPSQMQNQTITLAVFSEKA